MQWEQVTGTLFSIHRFKVDGGWIYCVEEKHPVFVPDIDLQRYQSHLRDAYNQGFKDGIAHTTELILPATATEKDS